MIKRDFAQHVQIPPIYLNVFHKEAEKYMFLENVLYYGKSFSKRFLGIVRNNCWVKQYYFLNKNMLISHLILKSISILSNENPQQRLYECVRCYGRNDTAEERKKCYLFHLQHIVFQGSPNQLFDIVFKNEKMWCACCKITSLVELIYEEDCYRKFGRRIHSTTTVTPSLENMLVYDHAWLENLE